MHRVNGNQNTMSIFTFQFYIQLNDTFLTTVLEIVSDINLITLIVPAEREGQSMRFSNINTWHIFY